MLLLGVGKAEAASLTGGAVDWEQKQISFVRKKTGEPFVVPIYPWAEDFVRELQPRFRQGQVVFDWRNPRKALITACTHCGVEPITTVSLRRTLIIHLLEKGIEPRLVAQWQGHRDATLIHKVYGKHINAAHERAQLAKLVDHSRTSSRQPENPNLNGV
jgi:integrase